MQNASYDSNMRVDLVRGGYQKIFHVPRRVVRWSVMSHDSERARTLLSSSQSTRPQLGRGGNPATCAKNMWSKSNLSGMMAAGRRDLRMCVPSYEAPGLTTLLHVGGRDDLSLD